MSSEPVPVDRTNAAHYVWGTVCDGWRLLNLPDLTVIEERVPAGAGEVAHVHARARQFFFVLAGVATLEFERSTVTVQAGQGVHVAPGVRHRFANRSDADVVFLVISAPSAADDRTNLA